METLTALEFRSTAIDFLSDFDGARNWERGFRCGTLRDCSCTLDSNLDNILIIS